MAATDVLSRLHCAGFAVRADGNRLLVAPAEKLSDTDRQAIREHRTEMLVLVLDPDPRVTCMVCRHLRAGHCRNHRAAGLTTSEIGRDLAELKQHCAGHAPAGWTP